MGFDTSLAASIVGTFFMWAGWNKLFLATRRAQMGTTMDAIYGWSWGPWIAWLVGISELVFGAATLALAAMRHLNMWAWPNLAVLPLLIICIEAFRVDGYPRMRAIWSPEDWRDEVACWLYTPEVLLAALCIIALF